MGSEWLKVSKGATELARSDFLVFRTLCDLCHDVDEETGDPNDLCKPKKQTLADRTGLSTRSIARITKRLARCGRLAIIPRFNAAGAALANHYRLSHEAPAVQGDLFEINGDLFDLTPALVDKSGDINLSDMGDGDAMSRGRCHPVMGTVSPRHTLDSCTDSRLDNGNIMFQFERDFWLEFPDGGKTDNRSYQRASGHWDKLSDKDKERVVSTVAAYCRECEAAPWRKVMKVENYLRFERWKKIADVLDADLEAVQLLKDLDRQGVAARGDDSWVVRSGTPEWDAWVAHNPTGLWAMRSQWSFPSRWPPGPVDNVREVG